MAVFRLISLAIGMATLIGGTVYGDPLANVKVTARVEERSKVILVFTNGGGAQVSFDRINFEHPFFNMFLVVHGSDEPINQHFIPDAVSSKSIVLNAGESYEHVVQLDVFRDFEKIAKRQCLVFHWSSFFEIGTLPDRPFFGGAVNVNCPNRKVWP